MSGYGHDRGPIVAGSGPDVGRMQAGYGPDMVPKSKVQSPKNVSSHLMCENG